MKIIKFRAKAIVSNKYNNIKVGDFVFGCYIETECDAPCIIFGDGEQIEIDKRTLGQMIQTKSRNNTCDELYEGDIVNIFGVGHCELKVSDTLGVVFSKVDYDGYIHDLHDILAENDLGEVVGDIHTLSFAKTEASNVKA